MIWVKTKLKTVSSYVSCSQQMCFSHILLILVIVKFLFRSITVTESHFVMRKSTNYKDSCLRKYFGSGIYISGSDIHAHAYRHYFQTFSLPRPMCSLLQKGGSNLYKWLWSQTRLKMVKTLKSLSREPEVPSMQHC